MAYINTDGYLERHVNTKTSTYVCSGNRKPKRNWWLGIPQLYIGYIRVPETLQGERLRFKVEVIKLKRLED